MSSLHFHEEQYPAIFSKKYACPYPQGINENVLEDCLRGLIVRLTEWVRLRNGMVGHIKILSEGCRIIWLSSTGGQTYVKNADAAPGHPLKFTLYVTAIVFKVPHDEFNIICQEFVKSSMREVVADITVFQLPAE